MVAFERVTALFSIGEIKPTPAAIYDGRCGGGSPVFISFSDSNYLLLIIEGLLKALDVFYNVAGAF